MKLIGDHIKKGCMIVKAKTRLSSKKTIKPVSKKSKPIKKVIAKPKTKVKLPKSRSSKRQSSSKLPLPPPTLESLGLESITGAKPLADSTSHPLEGVHLPEPPSPPSDSQVKSESKKGFFSKLFGKKESATEQKAETTEELMDDLDKLEQSLLGTVADGKKTNSQTALVETKQPEKIIVPIAEKKKKESAKSKKQQPQLKMEDLQKDLLSTNVNDKVNNVPVPLESQIPSPPAAKKGFLSKLFEKKTSPKASELSSFTSEDELEKLEKSILETPIQSEQVKIVPSDKKTKKESKSKSKVQKAVEIPTPVSIGSKSIEPKLQELKTEEPKKESSSFFGLFKNKKESASTSEIKTPSKKEEDVVMDNLKENTYEISVEHSKPMGLREKTLYELEKKKYALQNEVKVHEQNLRNLETQKRDKLEQIDLKHRELIRREEELARKLKHLDDKKVAHDVLHESLQKKAMDHKDMESRLKDYNKQIAKLDSEINSLYVLKDRLQKENNILKQQLNEREKSIIEKERFLELKEKQIASNDKDLQESKKLHLEMHDLLKKRKVEFETKSQMIFDFENQRRKLMAELEKLKIDKDKLDILLIESQSALQEKQSEKKKAEQESKSIAAELEKVRAQLASSKSELSKAVKDLKSKNLDVSKKEKLLAVLEKKISGKQQKLQPDAQTKEVLMLLDDLLGKLPENEIEAFSKSGNFGKYEKLMAKYGIK